MIQFLKRGDTGEYRSLQRLGVDIDTGDRIEAPPWEPEAQEQWREHTLKQFQKGKQALHEGYDVVILDELMTTVMKGFVDEADVIALARGRNEATELVTTGRGATPALIDAADLATEMRMVKHYCDRGVYAREGIEF